MSADPAADHGTEPLDLFDGLYLRGEAPVGLEDEASRLYGAGWGL